MRTLFVSFMSVISMVAWMFCVECLGAQVVQKANDQIGYCCADRKVVSITESACLTIKGRFFTNPQQAKQECGNHADRPGSLSTPHSVEPSTGYCCVDGIVAALSEDACTKRQGSFASTNAQALRICRKTAGYCCIDGDVKSVQRQQCEQAKGRFFETPQQARQTCSAMKGYCCVEGGVSESTKADCDKKKGSFSIVQQIVERECAETKGYCCAGAETIPQIKVVCDKMQGSFSTSRMIVEQACAAVRGYCCAQGTVLPAQRGSCDRRHGFFSTDKKQVDSLCQHKKLVKKSNSMNQAIQVVRKTGIAATDETATRQVAKSAGKTMLNSATFGVVPSAPSPEIVPFRFDQGIDILNPVGSDRYYRGDTVTVLYRLSGEQPSSGNIDISIMNRAGILAGEASVPIGQNPVNINLRPDAPVGTYFVMISHPSGLYGESDGFDVHHNAARIDFLEPNGDSVIHPGGRTPVAYQFNRRVQPGPIIFELRYNGTVYATETVDYTPAAASLDESRHTFRWAIPSGIPNSDDYIIFAHHTNASGLTERFKVESFRDMGGMATPFDLQVLQIRREPDARGRVIIRVSASGGFVADDIDIGVKVNGIDAPTVKKENLPPGESDVVIGEMPEPLVLLGMDTICQGSAYLIEIDPDNEHAESSEDNNVTSARLFVWDERTTVVFKDTEGNEIFSGGGTRIPCSYNDTDYVERYFALAIKNCGAAERVPTDVTVRQSGRRQIPGELGDGPFDEVISYQVFYDPGLACARRDTHISGRIGCALIRIPLSGLTRVDSLLTLTGGPLESPFTVDVNFGERAGFSGGCTY